jgi:MFS family permease
MATPAGVTRRPAQDGWLLAVCASRAATQLVFLIYPASVTLLRQAWQMSATAAGSISTGFQLGYAVSLFGCSWLADRIGARRVYLGSLAGAAAAAVAFALLARSYRAGLVLYTLVALALGGTYTTLIMLLADRYEPARRGGAMGWLIAASSLGSAVSLASAGLTLPRGGYPLAFAVASGGVVVGAVLGWLAMRGVPNVVHRRGTHLRFGQDVGGNPAAVRLIAGYVFHSWELLAMWAWTPAFLAASLATTGAPAGRALAGAAYVSAGFHLIGLLASATMGRLSDRLGRRTVLVWLAGVSAACSLVIGWLVAAPPAVVVAVGALYAFAALGDSPVLSVALTETVPAAVLGTTLALRSLLGFGAGAVAPLVFGAVLDATNPPGAPSVWGWAYVTLGVGGVLATVCALTLGRGRA